jgi:peptidoglycan/xylan/chitin deacetylase (PgdA/CDA1 family)
MTLARQAVKRVARIGLHQWGGLQPALWWTRRRFRILTYHRFPKELGAEGALEAQCRFLARHFRLTPLKEIAKALQSGAEIPAGTLAVTVDDGYRDFLTDAYPVFSKWKIPVTVYLISDFLDGTLWPWWDQVGYAIGGTRREAVSILGEEYALKSGAERAEAAARLTEKLKRIGNRERVSLVHSLAETFELEIPKEAPRGSAPMTWAEVRELASAGVEFGAHTKSHPILTRVEDAEGLREEIAGSKARIERETGRAAIHFCYPNGDWNDATEAVVRDCGFDTAVTTEPGLNRAGEARYRLKRLSVEPGLPREYFREQLAGMHV